MTWSPFVGTAGWSLPRADQWRFEGEGTHLERYARVLPAAEINSSFYRPHRPELYAKWAASVPATFRFSVKIPKAITHERRLVDCEQPLAGFLDQVAGLGGRLGCLLVQLPPSLTHDATLAESFLAVLRLLHDGPVALEPRHPSWFSDPASRLMAAYDVARVGADPARVPEAAIPGGSSTIVYYRLHGSPRIYYSPYDAAALDARAEQMRVAHGRSEQVWCIFDNTASGAALPNALDLLGRFGAHRSAIRSAHQPPE